MSRLDFAPKIDRIQITDIKRGLALFTPRSDKRVSFAALKTALRKAGYTLDSALITITGTLARDDSGWWIEATGSGQRFSIEGDDMAKQLQGHSLGAPVELTGVWQTVSTGSAAREVIQPRTPPRSIPGTEKNEGRLGLAGVQVSISGLGPVSRLPLTPIRTTSPGLTVYRGGAVTPRYSFTRQHLDRVKLDRHLVRLGVSYTPTPTLQLEADVPYSRTSFQTDSSTGSGGGFGNVTLWGKYRFYRELETWGDRQAAVRVGFELPTGRASPPAEDRIDAPEFVRRQMTPINGGFSFHADAAYSQAKGRLVYGANLEAILRSERDGFRTGHEVRINTDLEYVLLPLRYRKPTNELFVLLETTTALRERGRIGGRAAPGSSSSEFLLAPGLQYVPTERFLVEASYQLPVVRNTGPLILRTDRNLLIGVRYLY